jgi:NAD(P)-dependent dehydrogenase (short-subunit alcohol dehydrogenase family)
VTGAVAAATGALTRGLALDFAPIRVNAVCAGVVKTPLWNNMTEEDREKMYTEQGSRLPVGRVGEPEDIAGAYLYFMQSGFTTGQVIIIDGGAVIS